MSGAGTLEGFAAEVGTDGPVAVVGGRTAWDVGGLPDPSARLVAAPRGLVEHRPAEMIVRVGAGTAVADLDTALEESGQMVPLDPADPGRATVGGVLAVGRSGLRRLRHGPVRDWVLECRFVSWRGELVRAGAPVVKNVSGFDLVRLLVGSLGTLGLLGEVVLRTFPRPASSAWLRTDGPPDRTLARLYRPSSVLWDGATTWVLLEGHPGDVEAQARLLGDAWHACEGPPAVPGAGRLSVDPARLAEAAGGWAPGTFLAEMGVGVVHHSGALPGALSGAPGGQAVPAPGALHRRLKAEFDPVGRLNPGRTVG